MYSVVSHLNIFPIWSNVNLSCGGGNLGFLIGITNLNYVEDLPVINDRLLHTCLRERPFNLKRGGGGGLWFFSKKIF